jgi:hypothetical protein
MPDGPPEEVHASGAAVNAAYLYMCKIQCGRIHGMQIYTYAWMGLYYTKAPTPRGPQTGPLPNRTGKCPGGRLIGSEYYR